MVHIFGIDDRGSQRLRSGENGAVPIGDLVANGNSRPPPKDVVIDHNAGALVEFGEPRERFVGPHLDAHLCGRIVKELLQDLGRKSKVHCCNQFVRSILLSGFGGRRRCGVEQDIRVEKRFNADRCRRASK